MRGNDVLQMAVVKRAVYRVLHWVNHRTDELAASVHSGITSIIKDARARRKNRPA
jgi:hypothetical protein